MERIISAFQSNYPILKPYFSGKNEKRKMLRHLDIAKPIGMAWQDVPILSFNPNVLELLKLSLAKLGVGFFYLSRKTVAPLGSNILVFVERDISLKTPMQLEAFEFEYKDMLAVKNPNDLAQQQISIKTGSSKDQKLFVAHIRLNNSILSSVVIATPPVEHEDIFKGSYTVKSSGFPWGEKVSDLLEGKPGYAYYSDGY